MKYNWQLPDWGNFKYDDSVIDSICIEFAFETGELKGLVDSLSTVIQQETILQFMIAEAIKTSEIEGEFFSRKDIASSLKKNLGISDNISAISDKNAQGIAKLMVMVRNSYSDRLKEITIKEWHAILMEYSRNISPGEYRGGEEPMQIVSGNYNKEIVHFEAPPSNQVPDEMKKFIKWYQGFEVNRDIKKALVKTAISHLYFESIHPFEDGNGRIGRAIAEKCLSESLNRPVLMSISSTIEQNKKAYYQSLKVAQRTLEITGWIFYFSNLILESQKDAKQIVLFTLTKSKFIDQFKDIMNERQAKVVLKMFEKGISGFTGGMTAIKYISITKTSRATATRDLQDLTEKGIFRPRGEGRNRSYDLNLPIKE